MGRQAEIIFRINLDHDQMPSKIEWNATDSKGGDPQNCEAMLISLWDNQTKNTLGIDLWTKQMLIDDMNIFVYQTLNKLAETYNKATNDKDTANIISNCAAEVAEKLNLLNK